MNTSNIQAIIDGISAQMQRERSKTQMTLGEMIKTLEFNAFDKIRPGIASPHSYRGYYCDIAFEQVPEGEVNSEDLLNECKSAMGQVFEGYKGGDYMMGANTPVWIAAYGCIGKKLMGINPDGSLETQPDE